MNQQGNNQKSSRSWIPWALAGWAGMVGVIVFNAQQKEKEPQTPAIPREIPGVSEPAPALPAPLGPLGSPQTKALDLFVSKPATMNTLTTEQQEKYEEHMKEGVSLYQKEKLDDSIIEFRAALAIDPLGKTALAAISTALYDKGYYTFTGARMGSAQRIEAATKYLNEAVTFATLALETYPKDAQITFTLAAILEYRSRDINRQLSSTPMEDRAKVKELYESYLVLEPTGAYAADAKQALREIAMLAPVDEAQSALDDAAINATIARYKSGIQNCYKRALIENEGLQGKITVDFSISEAGRVISASASEDTIGNAGVQSCVLGIIGRLKFPTNEGGGTTKTSSTFVFEQAQ